MKNKIFNILYTVFIKSWQKRLVVKISFLMWILILITVGTYVLFSVPFQKTLLIERMNNEAQDVASSFIHANASAIITDDYQLVVDYSVNMLKTSNSIDYIVVTRQNGTSLVFENEGWSLKELDSYWLNPGELTGGKIMTSSIIEEETYHLSRQFLYSGVDWGWVHIGLSLNNYYKAIEDFNERTIFLTLIVIIVSLMGSIIFSKRITRPIVKLAQTAKKIEDGDLSVRVNVSSYDEIGDLTVSFNNMTEAVSKSKDELEAKVLERTDELNQVNKNLIQEVEEKEKAQSILSKYTSKLEILEEVYKNIISSNSTTEIIFETMKYLSEKLIPFTRASAAIYNFERSSVTLYTYRKKKETLMSEVTEHHIHKFGSIERLKIQDYFFVDDLDLKENKSEMEQSVFKEGRKSYLCIGLKSHGELVGEFNFSHDEPRNFDDNIIDTLSEVCNQLAVAIVQLNLEEKLQKHANDLQESLKQKEVLLKEVHHRVKNNLQIISSLLFLQAAKINDPEILSYYKDSQNRVRSLALVHEKLYKSKDLAEIDFADYLKNLSDNLHSSFKTTAGSFKMNFELDELTLSIDTAIPLGLIVNELLSNAFKYAFSQFDGNGNSSNAITIRLKKQHDMSRLLSVSDNGIGLPADFEAKTENSLGIKLIHSLVNQIDGKLSIKYRNNTEFNITF